MVADLLTAVGLGLDVAGLLVISLFAICAKDEDLTVFNAAVLGGRQEPIPGLFRERKMLRIGIPIMILGFVLQIIGAVI